MQSLATDDVTLLAAQVALLLAAAIVFGAIARRLGQPSVLGHIAAGVLIGPSGLSQLDWVAENIFPPERSAPLAGLAAIAALMVLAVTGFHTDPKLVRRWSRRVPALSVASLLIPLAAGAGLGVVLPAEYRGPEATAGVFVLFMAIALAISSPPVISRVLADAGLIRRDFAQIVLAVAMSNDVAGWVLLGVVISLTGTGAFPVGDLVLAVASLVALGVVAVKWGPRVVSAMLERSRRIGMTHGPVAVALVIIFAVSAFTNLTGIEAVLGAFVAALVIRSSKGATRDVEPAVSAMTESFFAPIFFTVAGLRVDLGALFEPDVAFWCLVAVAIASVTKLIGAGGVARLTGSSRREAAAIGVGLNIRGSLEVVLASVGLAIGVLNSTSYTIVVVVAVATSAIAPPLLRRITDGWYGDDNEKQRLLRERLQAATESLPDDAPFVLGSTGASVIADAVWVGLEPVARHTDGAAVVIEVETDLEPASAWLEPGDGPVLLVSGVRRLPPSEGSVLVPVVSSETSATAIEVAARIALASRADLTLVHLRRPGGSVASVERAAGWASTMGLTAQIAIHDVPSVSDDALAGVLQEMIRPGDVVVAGTTAHLGDGGIELGGCADRLFRAAAPLIAVVPAASGPFSPPDWA